MKTGNLRRCSWYVSFIAAIALGACQSDEGGETKSEPTAKTKSSETAGQTAKSKKAKKKSKKKPKTPPPEPGDVKLDTEGLSAASANKAIKTAKFMAQIRKVMLGYRADQNPDPKKPALPVNKILECKPDGTIARDKGLKGLKQSIKSNYNKVKNERRSIQNKANYENKKLRNFFNSKLKHQNHAIDYDWSTRFVGKKEPVGYYSQQPTPEMPELMKRLKDKGIDVPERIYCVIEDFVEGRGRKDSRPYWADCRVPAGETSLMIKTTEDQAGLQIGDLVSVPLRDTRVGDGVLRRMNNYRTNVGDKVWVADSLGSTFKVEEARANCPSQVAISTNICDAQAKRGAGEVILTHCLAAQNTEVLYEGVKRSDRRGFKNKNELMIKSLDYLSKQKASDLGVWMMLGKYQKKAKDNASSAAAYTQANSLASELKEVKQISRAIRGLEDETLASAVKAKMCEMGDQRSCPPEPEATE